MTRVKSLSNVQLSEIFKNNHYVLQTYYNNGKSLLKQGKLFYCILYGTITLMSHIYSCQNAGNQLDFRKIVERYLNMFLFKCSKDNVFCTIIFRIDFKNKLKLKWFGLISDNNEIKILIGESAKRNWWKLFSSSKDDSSNHWKMFVVFLIEFYGVLKYRVVGNVQKCF